MNVNADYSQPASPEHCLGMPGAYGWPDRRRPQGERRGGRERRQERRRPFVAAVVQRVHDVRWPLLGQATNLGRCGMLLRRCRDAADHALAHDTLLSVSFELPDGGSVVTLNARVVFEVPADARHFTTGLHFCPPPAEVQHRLDRYLTQSDPQPTT